MLEKRNYLGTQQFVTCLPVVKKVLKETSKELIVTITEMTKKIVAWYSNKRNSERGSFYRLNFIVSFRFVLEIFNFYYYIWSTYCGKFNLSFVEWCVVL